MPVNLQAPLRAPAMPSLRLVAMFLVGVLAACTAGGTARYHRNQLADTLAAPSATAGLAIGEFVLESPAVVDGDTIKVVGIEGTLRLLAIDTEETFKKKADLRAYDEGFDVYLAKKQGDSTRPIKEPTPLGMDAKHWAEEFFEGVRTVRLERDHPKELRGRYGRLLAYVLVEKDGQWLNYNVECVRAGMSPYFSKYGYSRRFHEQFEQAQAEAREAGRGIWDPEREHYRDYDTRLRWWNARAEVIARFEQEAAGRDNWIMLTHWDAMERLSSLEGDEVVVLATVGDIYPRQDRKPARVMLSRRMFSDLPLVFFDDQVLERSGVEQARGEFVRVQGTVSRYVFRTRRSKIGAGEEPPSQIQIQIQQPEQVAFVDTRPERIAAGYEPVVPAPAAPPVVDDGPPPPPAVRDPPPASAAPPEAPADDGLPPSIPPPPAPVDPSTDPVVPIVPEAPAAP